MRALSKRFVRPLRVAGPSGRAVSTEQSNACAGRCRTPVPRSSTGGSQTLPHTACGACDGSAGRCRRAARAERCGRWSCSRKLARGAWFCSKSDRRARQPNVDHGRVDTGLRTLRAVAAFPRTSRRPRPAGTPQQDGDRSTRQPSHAWRACHLRAQICSEGARGARHSLDMHALRFRCYINCRAVGAIKASAGLTLASGVLGAREPLLGAVVGVAAALARRTTPRLASLGRRSVLAHGPSRSRLPTPGSTRSVAAVLTL